MGIPEKVEKRMLDLMVRRFELEVELERVNAKIRAWMAEFQLQRKMAEQAGKQKEKQAKKAGKEKAE